MKYLVIDLERAKELGLVVVTNKPPAVAKPKAPKPEAKAAKDWCAEPFDGVLLAHQVNAMFLDTFKGWGVKVYLSAPGRAQAKIVADKERLTRAQWEYIFDAAYHDPFQKRSGYDLKNIAHAWAGLLNRAGEPEPVAEEGVHGF